MTDLRNLCWEKTVLISRWDEIGLANSFFALKSIRPTSLPGAGSS